MLYILLGKLNQSQAYPLRDQGWKVLLFGVSFYELSVNVSNELLRSDKSQKINHYFCYHTIMDMSR
jgi:hypothetical protein